MKIQRQREAFAYRLAATPEEARDEAVTPDNRWDFNHPWNPDMTAPADLDGPWYHSTYAELKPGDKILPLGQSPEDRPVDASGRPAESKYEWGSKPGMTNRNNFVWMYQDALAAYDWFQKYKRKKRNGPRGHLYVVKPDDTPQRWNNSADGEHVSHSATVVGELDPEALVAAYSGYIGGFGDPYHRERSKHPDSEIIREFFPDPPIAIPDDPYNRWRQKGYTEWSAKGWGSAYA